MYSHIFFFTFVSFVFCCQIKRKHCQKQCQGVYQLCFLLGILWVQTEVQDFNPLELISVYGIRVAQLSYHHFLKRFTSPHYIYSCVFCCQLLTIYMWGYFWALCSVKLIYVSVFIYLRLFRVFCGSVKILGLLVLLLWEMILKFW